MKLLTIFGAIIFVFSTSNGYAADCEKTPLRVDTVNVFGVQWLIRNVCKAAGELVLEEFTADATDQPRAVFNQGPSYIELSKCFRTPTDLCVVQCASEIGPTVIPILRYRLPESLCAKK